MRNSSLYSSGAIYGAQGNVYKKEQLLKYLPYTAKKEQLAECYCRTRHCSLVDKEMTVPLTSHFITVALLLCAFDLQGEYTPIQ